MVRQAQAVRVRRTLPVCSRGQCQVARKYVLQGGGREVERVSAEGAPAVLVVVGMGSPPFPIECVEGQSRPSECVGVAQGGPVVLVGREVEEPAQDLQREGTVSSCDAVAFVEEENSAHEAETDEDGGEGGSAEHRSEERVGRQGDQFEVGQESAGRGEGLERFVVGDGRIGVLKFTDFERGGPVAPDPQPLRETGNRPQAVLRQSGQFHAGGAGRRAGCGERIENGVRDVVAEERVHPCGQVGAVEDHCELRKRARAGAAWNTDGGGDQQSPALESDGHGEQRFFEGRMGGANGDASIRG